MIEKLFEGCENLGWSVSEDQDAGTVELESYSPAGENLVVTVEKENFAEKVREYAEDFDIAVYDGFCKTKSVMDQHSRILVSVSGGSDSDDMVDVVEHLKPGSGCEVDYVWFNTGIEMDATKAHIRYLKGRYGIEIHEESGKKKVAAAVRSVGYPFYSKQFSEYIERLQKHNFKWEDKPFDVLYAEYPQCKAALRWWCNNWKAEPHRPLQTEIASAAYLKEIMVRNPPTFSISKKCCDLAKKSAGDLARKKYAAGIQFIGVRKAEGGARSTNYKSCMSDGRHGLQYKYSCSMRSSARSYFFWSRSSNSSSDALCAAISGLGCNMTSSPLP